MIIGDSSALITLSIIDRLDLLEKIFKKVYVPQAVYKEVTTINKPQSLELKEFLKDKVIKVEMDNSFNIGLGDGELEAMALYKKKKADFLLIDDQRAKRFAKLNNINTIGSLGVIVLAKEMGLIDSIKADLEKLENSSIFISSNLIQKILLKFEE